MTLSVIFEDNNGYGTHHILFISHICIFDTADTGDLGKTQSYTHISKLESTRCAFIQVIMYAIIIFGGHSHSAYLPTWDEYQTTPN